MIPLARPRDVTGAFGIYIHIPFCAHRCWYCDFNTYAGLGDLTSAYMDALDADIAGALSGGGRVGDRPVVTTVFVGGGTPSLVDPLTIGRMLATLRSNWTLAPDAEVTMECNPETVTPESLAGYVEAGVTRFSFGVQSLDNEILAALGRTHDADTAVRAVGWAVETGVHVNADLIFGAPAETTKSWTRSVQGVSELGVDHISAYGLTYEPGTPLHAWKRLGKVIEVDEDEMALRWEVADEVLSGAGLKRYEISNWARSGAECRHNNDTWDFGEYLGLGAGAHSHLASEGGSTRSWTIKAPERYMRTVAAGEAPVGGSQEVDAASRAGEIMMVGLRRAVGVDSDRFAALTGFELGDYFGPQIKRWSDVGLLRFDGRRCSLTTRGTLLANEVLASFLPDA